MTARKKPRLERSLVSLALALVCVSAAGCASATRKPPAADAAGTDARASAGPWVFTPARFPERKTELSYTPEFIEVRSAGWTRRGAWRLPHRVARSETRPSGDFTLASAEGVSHVFDGRYRRSGDGDTVARQASRPNDPYQDLRLLWQDARWEVAPSDDRVLRIYARSTLQPLHESPPFAALRAGDRARLTQLLEATPATLGAYDELGRSLLYRAAQLGDGDTVSRLLARGLPADLRNAPPLERSPLAAAIRLSRLEIVDQLLAAGADPNLPDARGARPLHIAGEGCGQYRKIVRRLLAAGADPQLTNRAGETPRRRLELAKAGGFLPILDEEVAAARRLASRE